MVNIMKGNIFESKAQTLVNTVNCVGVMGKGIALEFKKRYPDMFQDYLEQCKRKEVKLGRPYLYKPLFPPWILNFPTKGHWRAVSHVDDIIHGLEYLVRHYKEWGITSLAVPPLGCGHGQLQWDVVGPLLYRYLSKLDIPVELYAPYTASEQDLLPELNKVVPNQNILQASVSKKTTINPALVALVEILKRIEEQPYHWPVGRTMFQKIAFVATKEGVPTGLKYQRGSYGPFAPELKEIITRLVNNGLIQENSLGRMFEVKVGPAFADARKAYISKIAEWESVIKKTADLFMRMKTDQAEIAATVLFAASELAGATNGKPTECDVYDYVLRWKQRRRPRIDNEEVASTIRNLAALDWLKVKPSSNLPISEEAWM